MNSNRLPSDALTKPATPIRTALITVAAIAVVAGLGLGGVAVGQTLTAHPTPTASALPADGPSPLSPAELAQLQQSAIDQQAQIAADAAAKAAADAAAQQAAAQAALVAQQQAAAAKQAAARKAASTTIAPAAPTSGYAPGQAPAGTPIPLHLDTDPNSGSYNQMVIMNPDQFCASNGGTTGPGGVQVCS